MANKKQIRLEKLAVSNYKGIGDLELSFPKGLVATDPDVNIFGSMNGVGKTSVLECCAWVLLALRFKGSCIEEMDCDFSGLVKSGERTAKIVGFVSGVKKSLHRVSISFSSSGRVSTQGTQVFDSDDAPLRSMCDRILGKVSEPACDVNFFFLHSYRKVREGRPELGMLLDDGEIDDVRVERLRMRSLRGGASFSMFKRLIVRHLMQSANLFESTTLAHRSHDDAAINVLNGLLAKYAEVKVGKLKPYVNNTIDVMVEKLSDPGKSFSIDGLSSGQKEIISTLFLIWNATYNHPRVVLIDEPELHLNEQWHAGFVNKLIALAPWNQYVLATHAKAIMASVRRENRHLLVDDKDEESSPL